jgi:DNA primase
LANDQASLIKHANDIVEVINDYVPLQRKGRVFKGLCPFHDDRNPSLDVNPDRQTYKCWSCGAQGDVFTFLQNHQKMSFREALELLARRAGIELKQGDQTAARHRSKLHDLMRWAEERFQHCLTTAEGEQARRYLLEERHLSQEIVTKYHLGYAPQQWTWLRDQAGRAGWSWEMLLEVGLCLKSQKTNRPYDAFRDRVIFPIRDVRGQTIAFGGRILPGSSQAEPGPKYYNSAESPLFTKSKHLYGFDQARMAAERAGYLAVVEGYTDVLMAHQLGVLPVVATLGTALNSQHIELLRKYVPRVVLVYDADAGGRGGVDRALALFISHEIDLAVATLPEGMDPCDFLLSQGAEAFRRVLAGATEALEFKLAQVCTPERERTIEGRRQIVEEVLRILALAPENPGQALLVKRDLIVTRLVQRFGIPEQTVRRRLDELRKERQSREASAAEKKTASTSPERTQRADPVERELVQVLLVEPQLVEKAQQVLAPDAIAHLGLRRVLEELYALHNARQPVQLEQVRARLEDKPTLADRLGQLYVEGLERSQHTQPALWLEQLLASLAARRHKPQMQQLKDELDKIGGSAPPPKELLSQYQQWHSVPAPPPTRSREP